MCGLAIKRIEGDSVYFLFSLHEERRDNLFFSTERRKNRENGEGHCLFSLHKSLSDSVIHCIVSDTLSILFVICIDRKRDIESLLFP